MGEQELVSVIIPCFNVEQYIDRSINSVFKQEWPYIELIIVDDGSTDTSAKKILAWENRFLHRKGYSLKYYFQRNKGVGAAVNKGLKHVSGQYITFLDADDKYLPEAISQKVDFLKKNPEYVMVRSNGYIVSEENKWLFTYNKVEKTEAVFDLLMRGKTYNWAGSYMVRTEALFDIYKDRCIYPSRYGQNLQIMIPVAYKKRCGYIDTPLMEYIQIGNSMTRETTTVERKKEKSIDNAKGFFDIREHVVNLLPLDNKEKQYWLQIAEGIYQRMLLQICIEYNDKEGAKRSFQKLLKLKDCTDDDVIQYYSYYNKGIALLYRIWRKVSRRYK